jgi:hypothetical protein
MNKTNEYSIHPYCFIFALPASKAIIPSVDCTEQAKQSEVRNDDGFIYSKYKQTGADKPLNVGYRFPKDFTPASADTFLVEVLVEDSEGHTYGSIVGGTILSPLGLNQLCTFNVAIEPVVVILVSLKQLGLA